MVKDHSDNERGNPLMSLHGLLFPISSKGSFICIVHITAFITPFVLYMHHPTDRIGHAMVFVTPLMGHWLEQKVALWVHQVESIQ